MTPADTECPYCGADIEINHDDGFGYEEDRRHEFSCGECDKAFVFLTSISFYYEAFKADCLNGTAHSTEDVHGREVYGYPEWVRCKDCEYENRGKYVDPGRGE